jgi:hypothetical protein
MLRVAAALLVLVLPCGAAADVPVRPQPNLLVAVLEFRSPLPEADRARFGERLRYARAARTQLAVAAPAAKVMTLDEMQRLAAANPDALNQCDDESCVSVGKLLGADAVVEGILGLDGPRLKATLRLFDVHKGGAPLAVAVVRGATAEALAAEVSAASARLAAKLPVRK